MSLDDIGSSVSYGEAYDLVRELQRESGSHLYAELNGYKFAASYGEIMVALLTEAFINANRDTKLQPQPVEMPMPFDRESRATFTPEERSRAEAVLEARSAFKSR